MAANAPSPLKKSADQVKPSNEILDKFIDGSLAHSVIDCFSGPDRRTSGPDRRISGPDRRTSVMMSNEFTSHKAFYFMAFFFLGLFNNTGYVVIGTAAADLS